MEFACDVQSMAEETSALKQALQSLANAIHADDESLADFRQVLASSMPPTAA
jgi:hypothetical protein